MEQGESREMTKDEAVAYIGKQAVQINDLEGQIKLLAGHIEKDYPESIVDGEMVVGTAIKIMKDQKDEIRKLNEGMGQMDIYIQKLERRVTQFEEASLKCPECGNVIYSTSDHHEDCSRG